MKTGTVLVLTCLLCAVPALGLEPYLVKDINPVPEAADSDPVFFDGPAAPGGVALFAAADGVTGRELWRSDGTPAGTYRVTDLRRGPEGSGLLSLALFKGRLYFTADDGRVGGALWKTDGTAAGTVLVKDPDPSTWANERPGVLRVVGNRLVFLGPVPGQGWELWTSDGTGKGTQVLGDFARGQASLTLYDTSLQGGRLYLVLDDGRRGQELWVTDGTPKGTRLLTNLARQDAFVVSDFGPGKPFEPGVVAGGQLLFAGPGPEGRELWVTDGTGPSGTRLVRDINQADLGGSNPRRLMALGDRAVFFADGADRVEGDAGLWWSDGTAAGTHLVRDVEPGPASSEPIGLISFQGKLYFTAWNEELGRELWVSDGVRRHTGGHVPAPARVRRERVGAGRLARVLPRLQPRRRRRAMGGGRG